MVSQAVGHVAEFHGLDLGILCTIAETSRDKAQRFHDELVLELEQSGSSIPPSLDVVLLGSFGRFEVTAESDCDYLILVDDTPPHHDIRRVVLAVHRVLEGSTWRSPGATGTFGDFVTGTELFGRIGLESDSNANTTRRLLLLTESVSVLNPDVGKRIREAVIERYLVDYAPDSQRYKAVHVPHFLLNDLTRYWRTMAVDFGAKQWRSLSSDWFLRYAKLLTTRKILFAGTLALLLDTENAVPEVSPTGAFDSAQAYEALTNHLAGGFALSPLDRLMSVHDRLGPDGQSSLARILTAYDSFLGMLDDSVQRAALNAGKQSARAQVKDIGDTIHQCLLVIFFDDPLFATATREYSLF